MITKFKKYNFKGKFWWWDGNRTGSSIRNRLAYVYDIVEGKKGHKEIYGTKGGSKEDVMLTSVYIDMNCEFYDGTWTNDLLTIKQLKDITFYNPNEFAEKYPDIVLKLHHKIIELKHNDETKSNEVFLDALKSIDDIEYIVTTNKYNI